MFRRIDEPLVVNQVAGSSSINDNIIEWAFVLAGRYGALEAIHDSTRLVHLLGAGKLAFDLGGICRYDEAVDLFVRVSGIDHPERHVGAIYEHGFPPGEKLGRGFLVHGPFADQRYDVAV